MPTTKPDLNTAAEAICSALWRTDWQLLRETPDGTTLWKRGDPADLLDQHRAVRVTIERSAESITVRAWWWSYLGGSWRHRTQYWVLTLAKPIEPACEYVVVKLLELYRDVLQRTGKAVS